jgi:hypothetical protein
MNFFAGRPRASQLRQWHQESRAAVDDRELKMLDLIARQLPVPIAILGMTPEEVAAHFEGMRRELDAATSLLALAEAEAVLRVDYLSRVQRRGKDAVSRTYRELHKEKGASVRLDEDILDTWVTQHGECKSAVSEFRAILNLRHWLAHGRYWLPKLGRAYAPQDAFDIADRLFAKLPGVAGWI